MLYQNQRKLGMKAGPLWWITQAQGRAAEITLATNLEVALESQGKETSTSFLLSL